MRPALGLALLLAAGCAEPAQRYPVVIMVQTDDGQPLENVLVYFKSTLAGKTDAEGKLLRNILGKEGEEVPVTAEVPKGYRVAEGTHKAVVLRRLLDIDGRVRPLQHTVKLAPLERRYVVLVRAGVVGLPVEAFGAEKTVTNERGVAMFVYGGASGDELTVRLNTEGHPELRPQNPSATFLLAPRPEAYVFNQKFSLYKPPAKKKPKPTFQGPKRL